MSADSHPGDSERLKEVLMKNPALEHVLDELGITVRAEAWGEAHGMALGKAEGIALGEARGWSWVKHEG
jgi:hypothetical protein